MTKRILLMASLMMLVASPIAALSCKPRLDITGPSFLTIIEAREASRLQWMAVALQKHGTAYSDWRFTQKSAERCRQITGTAGIRIWVCRQRAKPCKP